MSEQEVVDLGWIGTCNHRDAEEALRILDEVLMQLDRGNIPITVNPRRSMPGGLRPPPDQHVVLVRWRQEVMLMLTRRRIFRASHYFDRRAGRDGECFTVDAEEALIRRARELFQARMNGEQLTGVLSWQAMNSAQAPLTWLDDVPTDILTEARDILQAAVHELALDKTTMRISPFPSEYEHHAPPLGQEERLMAKRRDVAELLVRRGVLNNHRSDYVGGPNAREEDRGNWLTLEGSLPIIRHALEQVSAHLAGRDRYRRAPENMRSALPTPPWVNLPVGGPVNNYYGPTNIAHITSTGDRNTITVTIGQGDLDAIADLVDRLKGAINELGLDAAVKREVEAEVATIEAQARSSKPKRGILKVSLEALATALATATAHEIATPLAQKVSALLQQLAGH